MTSPQSGKNRRVAGSIGRGGWSEADLQRLRETPSKWGVCLPGTDHFRYSPGTGHLGPLMRIEHGTY
jgi:hypothetical protein